MGEGLGLPRTFHQQFPATLKTGSQLSREPPAVFPEPPSDAGWGCAHAHVCTQAAGRQVEPPARAARACAWVPVSSVASRGGVSHTCAKLCVLACDLHLSQCGKQMWPDWCICESGFRCYAWVSISSGYWCALASTNLYWRVLACAGLCQYRQADRSLFSPGLCVPRQVLIQLSVVSLDTTSSLLQI